MNEESLFAAALEKSNVAERQAFLDDACAGDDALRQRLGRLLAADERAAGILEGGPAGLVTTPVVREALAADTLFAGHFQLRQKLGEGGMGEVWVADQREPVQRRVAVKVVRTGLDSARLLARFEQERQALALMDHPNIAKVLDAGSTPSGLPYFVMELIQGVPITDYCDTAQLSPRARLGLFVDVCQAVQHAHQKGVIHRDLKPSNVLVAHYDGRPVVKVIDFGVAKATGRRLSEHSVYTEVGTLVGTLEYMSPEQAELNNLDVDTRSDVYALGVLLYELLTGRVPHSRRELQAVPFTEMLRIIKEVEPPRPSTRLASDTETLPAVAAVRRTEPKKLTALVRGEPDWIVMKCLEKDRNRRYQTANGLAMDLQRYLADEPVQACPPSAGYRVRKFVRRNQGPVLAASLVFLALVGGVIGTTWGLVRAERARQGEEGQRHAAEANAERAVEAQGRAEQGFAKANSAVEHYLKAVTDDPDLTYKHDLHALRKKLLEAAVPFYQWFTEQRPGEAALEAERGRAYWRLAFVRSELGEKEAALKDYEHMRTIFARLAADFPTVPTYRWHLAKSHNNRGLLLKELGQQPAAEQAYRQARDLFEELAAEFPAVPEYRRDLAGSHNNRGNLLAALGQRPAAEQAHRRALELQEALAAEFPAVPTYRRDLAASHLNLGNLLKDRGQRPAAEQAYRRARDLFEQLAAEPPAVPEYRRDLAASHLNLGNLLKDRGQRPAAEQAYRRAQDIYERLAADFPSVPEYRRYLAMSHDNRGNLLAALGQQPAAEQAYRRALELLEKLAAEFPGVPAYHRELARSHNNLGVLLANLGQRPAAEQAHRRARDIYEKLAADFPAVPEYRQELAMSHNSLGMLLAAPVQRPAAEPAYRRALELREKLAAEFPAVPEYRRDLAGSCVNFGHLLRDQGQAEASLDWFAKAVALLGPLVHQEPRPVTERLYLRNAHWGRARALDGLGRHADAREDWDRVLALNAVPAQEPVFRRGRTLSLARGGEHAKAVADATALAEAKDVDARGLYDLACVCAVAAAAVQGDAQLQGKYAARAVELLRRAVAAGFTDVARMKKDPDLDALRDREDWQQLVAALGTKAAKALTAGHEKGKHDE